MEPIRLQRDQDGVVRWGMPPDIEPVNYCHCGREMRKLNVASWRVSCVGCGLPEAECRCQPTD